MASERESSLVLSPLSSPLATYRTLDTTLGTGEDGLTDVSTKLSHRMVTAKIEVSDLFLPLERRLQERLDDLEASLGRRCGVLEGKVTQLTDEARGNAGGVPRLLQQAPPASGSLQTHLEKEALTELADSFRLCSDRQCALQSNIDELWRQIKADRQESVNKFRVLSDTTEMQFHSLLSKVNKSCSDLAGAVTDLGPAVQDDLNRTGSSVGADMEIHVSESAVEFEMISTEQGRLPTLLGGRVAQKTCEQCTEDVAGSAGTERRRSAGARTAAPLSTSALCARSPQSPSQVHRSVTVSSPVHARPAASHEAEPRARRPSGGFIRAVSPGAPSTASGPGAQGLQVGQTNPVKRMTSAPYDTTHHAQRANPDAFRRRTQAAASLMSRSQRELPLSPILGGGATHAPTNGAQR